jgi:hypothetical protein
MWLGLAHFHNGYSFLMISPNLHDIWPVFFLVPSRYETAHFLIVLRLPGDGYSLLGSKNLASAAQLRFKNNFLTIECVCFTSISKKTPLSKLSLAFGSISLPLLVYPNQPPMQLKGNKILPNLLYATKVR